MNVSNHSIVAATLASIFMTCALDVPKCNAIALSTNKGVFVNTEVIELGLIFNRFLKKLTEGEPKKPFVFLSQECTLATLSQLEKNVEEMNESELLEFTRLFAYVKKYFIQKTKRFVDCSRDFTKALHPLIEEDCVKRNRSNSFLRSWIKTDKEESMDLFDHNITSFTDLYILCGDLMYLIKDVIYSCPKTLHNFELRIQKIKRFKTLLPEALEELSLSKDDINAKLLTAEFKKDELSLLSLDEINKDQVCVLIKTFLKEQKEQNIE